MPPINPEATQPELPPQPAVNVPPRKKINKLFIFLFIFLGIDILLALGYLYMTDKLNLNFLSKKQNSDISSEGHPSKKSNEVGILSLAYIPLDKNKLDLSAIDNSDGKFTNATPDDIKNNVDKLNTLLAGYLQDGTKFHYYERNWGDPAVNYNFYKKITKFQTVPFTSELYPGKPDVWLLDYNVILGDVAVCDMVDSEMINEVWIWTYPNKHVKGWTSNMSGPYGDISNSDKLPYDMPKCKYTYTVYVYDYSKDVSVALLQHLQQFETLFSKLNLDLFWYKYVGYFANSKWEGNLGNPLILDGKRRCGSSNFPPNATDFNQWDNHEYIPTDCPNWDPNGKALWDGWNCEVWGCTQTGYYVFWMQNIPGPDNNLNYNGAKLRNWWDFISDFDNAMKIRQDLVY